MTFSLRRSRACVFVLALAASGGVSAQRPPALPAGQLHQLNSVLWMQRSPEYALLARSVFASAQAALPAALAQPGSAAAEQSPLPPGAGAAVIVDLDETMLDNSPFQAWLVRSGAAYRPQDWDAWVARKSAQAIPGAVEFAKAVTAMPNTTIFYVSNRECKGPGACAAKQATMENMRTLGFPRADEEGAFLFKGEEADERGDKVTRRTRIGRAYRIIMLVGDDMRDFVAKEDADLLARRDPALMARAADLVGRRWFILPNAMYGSWVDRLGKTPAAMAEQLTPADLPAPRRSP